MLEYCLFCTAAITEIFLQVKLREVVKFVAETIGQDLAEASLASCADLPTVILLAGQLENKANAVCQQKKTAQSLADLQAQLQPLTERVIAELIPKVCVICLRTIDISSPSAARL